MLMRTVTPFHYGHAGGQDWQEAAQSCLTQLAPLSGSPNLGFLYVTDLLGKDLEDILAYFKRHTGIAHWVGTVGVGICATGREYLDEPAIAVMAGEFSEGSFYTFSGMERGIEDTSGGGRAPLFAIVHADPRTPGVARIVAELAAQTESGFLVGGLTSSRAEHLQVADRIVHGGVSGVAFHADVEIATRHTQGCTPIGPKHLVTECERNILITLDNRPALDVFNEDIGEVLARDLNRVAGYIFAGLPITGSDTGDYLVRNVVGIDPRNRMLAIGEIVQPGAPIMFCRRDSASAQEDMVRMLHEISRALPRPPKGGVYVSCLGRGENMFGRKSAELELIRQVIGDFPLVGFFANGEISHNRLYGYTGVLTLFT